MRAWLFVVSRTDLERYLYLKHAYADQTNEVIFDRRVGQRRRSQTLQLVDRRQAERRRSNITEALQSSGWAVVTQRVGDHPRVATLKPMLRWLIQLGLEDGRLPRGRITDVMESPGDRRRCDGCGAIITKAEKAVTGISEDDQRDVRLHTDCFEIWETERVSECRRSPITLLDRGASARAELDRFFDRREEVGRFYCGACLVAQLTQRGARKIAEADWTAAIADAFKRPGALQMRFDRPCEACQKSRPTIGAKSLDP